MRFTPRTVPAARVATLLLAAVVCLVTRGAIPAAAGAACTLDRATGTTIDAKPFLPGAYGTRYNAATRRIGFMRPDATGYYRVFIARPDGGAARALAADLPAVPQKHQGPLYWHPSGKYVLFAAQKPEWSGPRLFGNPDFEALPGFGRHDDLWLADADGRRAWQLTNDPNTKDEGILMPVFSPDGKHVAWSARRPGGTYELVVADFVETPQPHLAHRRGYLPGGPRYYETGSFTSDGASLMYTSDQDTHSFWASQIYRLDLATGHAVRLTTGFAYNEHPSVIETPTGDWVVYMSTKGVQRRPLHLMLGTDWYAMRPDGSDAKRLTTMNVDRPDPENAGFVQVATAVAPGPSGSFMYGDVQDSLVKQTGFIRIVRFTCR